MPVNRFQKIRNNIHINSAADGESDDCNKFWKIQPLVERIRSRCLELPREEYCSVDEQMISFERRATAKQFVANKSNLIGLKNFVLCGKSDRALDFELYQGAGTSIPVFVLFYLPYLSSIHEKTNCIAILWTGSPHSLGSCLFRGLWATCLPHKGGASR